MELKIERNTRQWLGIVIIGGVIAGMIFAGLIVPAEYQKYTGFVVGAFFYHIIRMLNGPDQFRGATKMIAPENPTSPKEG